ncbi:hypothetical protein ACTFIY_004220 [Dictyostelium cf. discoideum]
MEEFENLFFKVWRNVYIRNEITKHLELFRDNYQVEIKINKLTELRNHPNKKYISKLRYHPFTFPNGCLNDLSSLIDLEIISFKGQFKSDDFKSLTSLKKLSLIKLNKELEINIIPSSIEELELVKYDQIIRPMVLPESLTKLTLSSFNQPIEKDSFNLLKNLKGLVMENLNHEINPNDLPSSSLNELYLIKFNKPLQLSSIPNSIEWLTLSDFNHPLKPNLLPSSLIDLSLFEFNQPLNVGDLPNGIIYLSLGYNQQLESDIIPASVTHLVLSKYDHPLKKGVIPSSVEFLKMNDFNSDIQIGAIPSSVKKLTLHWFNQPIKPGAISFGVEKIRFLSSFNKPLIQGSFPSSVKTIHFSIDFNQNIKPNDIPESCIKIKMGYCFNHLPKLTSNIFSNNLKKIIVDRNYNHPIPDDLKDIMIIKNK